MAIWQAVLISLIYFLANGTLIGVGFFTLYRPLVSGFVTGLILGDPVTGTAIGASINLMYIGHISAGGSLPGDPALAGIVGASLGITAGLDVAVTLPIATSVGLLGALLWFGRLTINSIFVRYADSYAREGKAGSWWIVNVLLPQGLLFFITAIPAFFIVYFGANSIQDVLNALGGTVLNSLMIIGGLLPALGLGLTLNFVFQKDAKIYFFLGFLMVVYFSLDMIAMGYLSLIIAIIYFQIMNVNNKEKFTVESDEIEEEAAKPAIPTKTLFNSYINWTFHAQGAYNYERMMGLGFAHSMVPAFKLWYKDKSEEMAEALKRHTTFYNTSPQFATMINGLVLAMEEKRYQGSTEFDDDTINAVKTSLMGPMAGIGDTITQGVIVPLLLSFFIGMSLNGNIAGPILYTIAVVAIIFGGAWWLFIMGYRKGYAAIVSLLESGYINKIIDAAKVMGCLVVGALVANYVKLKLNIVIPFGPDNQFNLQEQLFDAILPQILPLLFTFACYKLINRGLSSTKVMLLIVVFGVIGGVTGLLASF